MRREILVLSDGRNLEYVRNGVESDAVIIFHAGTVQDITGWKTFLDYCKSRGVAALAFGRSGYAGSTKKPGRITIDVAHDINELADALKIAAMVHVGLSGGGQHALACGLDKRTVGVVTSGSLAPFDEMGENFYTGMQQADLEEYADALRDINDLVARFKTWQDIPAEDIVATPDILENDVKAKKSPTWDVVFDSMGFTFAAGWDWVADDYSSYLKPWGFDPRDITVPVELWQAELDVNVPIQHGKWLAEHIPNSTFHLMPQESHVGGLVNYEKEITDSAIALLQR
jgi:pimeloyl-ACP methyl ester carboxylesterase